jgi:hypothetical protein
MYGLIYVVCKRITARIISFRQFVNQIKGMSTTSAHIISLCTQTILVGFFSRQGSTSMQQINSFGVTTVVLQILSGSSEKL